MNYIETSIKGLRFKETNEDDAKIVLELIKELAEYENMTDKVTATEDILKESLYKDKKAEALLIEYEEKNIGYIIYFYNFSTFTGKPGLYLEDVYVKPEFRGRGIGREAFRILAKIARKNKCERFEWVCLNWNKPSLKFYEDIGAKKQEEWIIHRIDKNGLNKF